MDKGISVRKGAAALLAAIFCVCAAAGCSGAVGTPSADACAEAVYLSQQNMPSMTMIDSADEGFASWLETSYGIDPETVTDGAAYYTDGTAADEIAVLRCVSSGDARKNAKLLEEYVEERRGVFSGYAPDAEYMLSEAQIPTKGEYVALLVCPSPSSAKVAFEGSFTVSALASEDGAEESASASPTASAVQTAATTAPSSAESSGDGDDSASVMPQDSYDHDAVLAAWESQDPTSLSAQNRRIYDAAAQIIQESTTDSMNPYQKERAVHDRLVDIIEYDPLALARDSSKAAPPESSTPYGALVLGQAICYGYSSSFQLLMDMLGIECITVDGTINDDNDPHSWNMVNLDGSWYQVDVGWDDPVNAGMTYTYFNRSDDEFQGYNRKWDRKNTPHATGGVWAGENANGV